MTKIGRNNPCWCGSGKKYKQCHLIADEATAGEQRRLKAAGDALLPRIIEQAQVHTDAIPLAFDQFWNGKYTVDQMSELDELEGRGAERFLTWFAFDYRLENGQTLVEQLAAGSDSFESTPEEAALLAAWVGVRLSPFVIESAIKSREMHVRTLLGEQRYTIEDQAASGRVEDGEVLIVHLLPIGSKYHIGGAAAHLTADTAETLAAFVNLQLAAFTRDHPGASVDDLLQTRSAVLNHFVMELPVEEPDPAIFEKILEQTRTALALVDSPTAIEQTADEH